MTVTACHTCGTVHDDGNGNDLTPLPDCYRITDPCHDLRDDLTRLITGQISNHPRSAQKTPGPSELGTPCQRRLGYKMLGTAEVNTDSDGWRPTVGTAVHTWLEKACHAYNDSHRIERYYVEQKVLVGSLLDQEIRGQCDVYDRALAMPIDWKVVGPTSLKKYRINGPGEQYRAQAHLYGRGYELLGLPVDKVAIVFLPSNGELRDLHVWSEPYSPQLAIDTLTRAEGVLSLTRALGPAALPLLKTSDGPCNWCPYRLPAATDLTEACPGHASPASTSVPAA